MTKMPKLSAPLAAALLVLCAPSAHALYKVVGPDGKVTYTDRPPASAEGRVQPVSNDGHRASEAQLPFALRQVAQRFPVTLYTASNCGDACALGRAHLAKRGIPFSERIAESEDERAAWPRIVGGTEAPAVKIGGQMLRGFSASAWDETLDLAGYPKESQLPPSYRAPAAMPLIERKPEAPKGPAPLPLPSPTEGSSPGGIRF